MYTHMHLCIHIYMYIHTSICICYINETTVSKCVSTFYIVFYIFKKLEEKLGIFITDMKYIFKRSKWNF